MAPCGGGAPVTQHSRETPPPPPGHDQPRASRGRRARARVDCKTLGTADEKQPVPSLRSVHLLEVKRYINMHMHMHCPGELRSDVERLLRSRLLRAHQRERRGLYHAHSALSLIARESASRWRGARGSGQACQGVRSSAIVIHAGCSSIVIILASCGSTRLVGAQPSGYELAAPAPRALRAVDRAVDGEQDQLQRRDVLLT